MPGRTADGPLGHLREDGAIGDHGAGRGHVLLDPDAAAPHRQESAKAVDEALPPARREGRRGAAEEPRARFRRDRVHHDERIHPAAVGGPDQQIAASRQELLAGGPDPHPEEPEDDEARHQPEDPVEDRRLRLRRPAKPGQPFDGTTTRRGERLRRDPTAWRSRPPGSRSRRRLGHIRSSSVFAGGSGSASASRRSPSDRRRQALGGLVVGLVVVARRRPPRRRPRIPTRRRRAPRPRRDRRAGRGRPRSRHQDGSADRRARWPDR